MQLKYTERRYRRPNGVHFTDNEGAIAHGWQHVRGVLNTFEQEVKAAGQQGELPSMVEAAWTAFEPTAFQAMLSQLTAVIYIQAKPTQTGKEA